MRAVKRGRLDQVEMPVAPLDIWPSKLWRPLRATIGKKMSSMALCREAWPYRELDRGEFDETVQILSEGIRRRQ